VPALLEKGRARADAEGLAVEFQVADAENLPFGDGSFDVVLSTYGAMFTPEHARPAREMLRVVRDGGRIGLANWTPEGFIGQLFNTIGKYLPPPTGVKSPAVWGTRDWVQTTFGVAASTIASERRHFTFRYRSAQHFLDVFRTYYGPVLKAFQALEGVDREALARDIIDLVGRFNTSGDKTMVVPGEYLEVVITKQ
jgi:ubiquinone/menaquinone biosynthesis C-methylase UbiE